MKVHENRLQITIPIFICYSISFNCLSLTSYSCFVMSAEHLGLFRIQFDAASGFPTFKTFFHLKRFLKGSAPKISRTHFTPIMIFWQCCFILTASVLGGFYAFHVNGLIEDWDGNRSGFMFWQDLTTLYNCPPHRRQHCRRKWLWNALSRSEF